MSDHNAAFRQDPGHDTTDARPAGSLPAQLAQATIDALQAHICVLDPQGTIVAVNRAWCVFGSENGLVSDGYGVGVNYLQICETAAGDDAELAHTFAAGLRSVLRGEADDFTFEYPCHGPDEKRWFLARVSYVLWENQRWVVVTHENTTQRKYSETILRESEERMERIIHSALDAMIMIDRQQRIILFNDAAQRVFGCLAAEAIGRPLEQFIPERFRGIHRHFIERYDASGISARSMGLGREVVGLRANGEEFPMEASITQLETLHGKRFTVALRDITAQKESQRVLVEKLKLEEQLGQIVRTAPSGLFSLKQHPDGTLSLPYVSPHWETLFQLSQADVREDAMKMFHTIMPEDLEYVQTSIQESATQMIDWKANFRVMNSQLGRRWVTGQATPVHESDGGVLWYGFITDITDYKRAEEELRYALEELKRSNAELEQFAYVASHDLQEPLRAVSGMVQLLQRRYSGQLDASADQYITHAVEGVTRMQTLITDLLTLSRVGRNSKPLAPVDMAAIVKRALANLTVAIQESGAAVSYGELPMIRADSSQLAQLFQNLLSNAIKFRGDQPLRIRITAERSAGAWCFGVHDNGIGIPVEHADRIFLIFQRLHTRAEYPGTGIGLALCKKIVEWHGGRIWVDSVSGTGSSFYFTIPDRVE